jgi:hypothetical protein
VTEKRDFGVEEHCIIQLLIVRKGIKGYGIVAVERR